VVGEAQRQLAIPTAQRGQFSSPLLCSPPQA
jgi:hypothetical protein